MGLLNPGGPIAQFKRNRCSISPVELILQSGVRKDYTGVVNYTARNKQDTTYLGRFTFDTILDFEGLNRVLTILARGFLFHNEDGSPVKAPRERIDYAKRGLCAWCSVPDSIVLLFFTLHYWCYLEWRGNDPGGQLRNDRWDYQQWLL